MTLKFSNQHIAFATATIWANINYKFKYHLNELFTANNDDDFVQSIDVPEDILIQIFSAVTVEPEGVAAFLNAEMLGALIPQVQSNSNLAAVTQGKEEPNEAARILIAINEIDQANKAVRASKILKGKNQILA